MTTGLRIGVGGALGRMGAAVVAIVQAKPGLSLTGRFDRPDTADSAGVDLPPLTSLAAVLAACDVIIDFSTGPATAILAKAALRGGPALVIGATGLSPAEENAVTQAAERVAVVRSGNYSVGVNVLAGLVEQAARRLGPEIWDI